MKTLRHQRILANAGSGKTYRLVSRYLELLVNGVAPEKISALTFTRKAAGEFLEKILTRLADAATSEKASATLARDTNIPSLTPSQSLALLRAFVEAFPRLSLATLDSFFGRVARAFPFELGMPGQMSLIDENVQAQHRSQVITRMLDRLSENEKGFEEFLETLRQQNRNQESRDVRGILDREIESLHHTFLTTPQHIPWGEADAIWPDGVRHCEAANIPALAEAFRETFYAAHPDMSDVHHAGWEDRFTRLRKCALAGEIDGKTLDFASRLITPSTRNGKTLIYLSKKPFALPEVLLPLAQQLGMAIFRSEIDSRLTRSAALWKLLSDFEALWEEQIRSKGSLTFLDITGLLALHDDDVWGSHETGGLSQSAIEFRMDSRTDHWLLDEFQDTSRLQWKALRGLVDEVLQNAEGNRTFFFVGDAKQSIYSWRGGDPRLFSEVADYYNTARQNHIDCTENLGMSWRSVPEITDAVNDLFQPATLQALAEELSLPETAIERWESAWCDHLSHTSQTGLGCVSRIVVEETEENSLAQATADFLRETLQRNPALTCAVLVRTNSKISEIVQALREAGLNAAAEGRSYPCTNNDLGTAILSLLQALAHPEDSLATKHASMTPLAALWQDEGFPAYRLRALDQLSASGYQATLQGWMDALSLEGFPAHCADAFLEAATAFDTEPAEQKAGIDAFIRFAENHQSSREATPDAIRVMTVHAAKGLDFDVVVLPDIGELSLASPRIDTIHLQSDHRGETLWGLNLPPADVCEQEPALQAATDSRRAESAYEALCVAYVALTRAKRSLTLITKKAGDSKARNFHRILDHVFGPDTVRKGNPDWLDQYQPSVEKKVSPEIHPLPQKDGCKIDPLPISPSEQTTRYLQAEHLFEVGGLKAQETGTEAHRLLSEIAWLEDRLPKLPSTEAGRVVSYFLKSEQGKAVFTRPAGAHTLWQEKAFDIILDGQWVSGVFDRVVIQLNEIGEPISAELIDFKTGREKPKAYAAQMESYQQALSALLGLPIDQISASLVPLENRD